MTRPPRAKWPRPIKPGEIRVRPQCTIGATSITIQIDEATPSQNHTDRWHFRVQMKHVERWVTLMLAAGAASAPKASGHRHVRVWRYADRDLDHGNLVGGCKHVLIDNLVKLGLLVDDAPKWMTAEYFQARPRAGFYPHTVVVLRDIEQGKTA